MDVGAVREPPVYRDIEHRTDMNTQPQDVVLRGAFGCGGRLFVVACDVAGDDQFVGFVVVGGVDTKSADLFLEKDGVESSALLAEGVGFPEVLVKGIECKSEVGAIEKGLLHRDIAFVGGMVDGFTELDGSGKPPDTERKESESENKPRDDGDALPVPLVGFLCKGACVCLKIRKRRERDAGTGASHRRRVIKNDIMILEAKELSGEGGVLCRASALIF